MPDLSLGTIFTANITQFLRGVAQARQALQQFNAALQKSATISAGASKLSGMQKIFSNLRNEVRNGIVGNRSYGRSLMDMAMAGDRSATSIERAIKFHKQMKNAVHATAERMNAAGKDGKAYLQTIDYMGLSHDILNGKMKMTSSGLVDMTAKLQQAGKGVNWVGKMISKVEGLFGKLTAAFKVTAAYMTAGLILGGVRTGLAEGVKEIVNFDQALKDLTAITGATADEVKAMENEIKKVAKTTKFSTIEVAEGMVLLAQAGLDATEAVDAINGVAQLATATLEDFEMVADLVTSTLVSFNKQAFETTQVVDIMANAINKSKLTVEKLRVAFNYVGPVAYSTGASLEETTAAMMIMSNAGLRASTIGTSLRQIFQRLIAPTDDLREAYERNKIELSDLDIKSVGFEKVLKRLSRVMVNVKTGAIDSRMAFELFGLRGASGIVSLLKAINSGGFKEALDSLFEVGKAAEMAQTQMEGLALKWKNLADRAKLLAIQLGEAGLAAVFRTVADGLKLVLDASEALLSHWIGNFVAQATIVLTTTLSLAGAFLVLYKGLGWIVKGLILVGKHLIKIPLGFGWIITGISLLITAYNAWSSKTAKRLEQAEQERIKYQKTATQMAFYRDLLKQLWEEGQKNSSMMYKYDEAVKRLAADFPELRDEIQGAAGDFKKLDEILEKHMKIAADKALIEALQASVEAYRQEFEKLYKAGIKGKALSLLPGGKNKVEDDKKQIDTYKESIKSLRETMEKTPTMEGKAYFQKQIDHLEQEIKKLEGVKEAHKEVKKSIEDTWVPGAKEFAEYARATEDGKKIIEETDDIIARQAKAFAKWYELHAEGGAKSEQAIGELLQKLSEFETLLGPERFYRLLKLINKETEKIDLAFKRMKFAKEMEAIPTSLSQIWRKATSEQKTALMGVDKQLDSEISSIRKWAEENKDIIKDQADLYNMIGAARGQAHIKYMQALDEEQMEDWRKYEKEIQIIDSTIEKIKEYYGKQISGMRAYYQERVDLEAHSADDIKDIREEEKKQIDKTQSEMLGALKFFEERKEKIIVDAMLGRMKFNKENAMDAMNTEIAYAEMTQKKKLAMSEMYDREAARRSLERQHERARGELAQSQDILQMLQEEGVPRTDTRFIEAMKEYTAALKEFYGTSAELYSNDYDTYMYYFDQKLRYAQEFLNQGKINAEEYLAIMKEAYKREMIDTEEYYDALIQAQGNLWENFKRGTEKGMRAMDTLNKAMQKFGEQVAEQVIDNLTDAFSEFISGTKSAKEAFRDFAADTLKWIAKILMKMALMNMYKSMFGGGHNWGSTIAGSAAGVAQMIWLHKGGNVGKEGAKIHRKMEAPAIVPKFHDGLNADEVLGVLKKDETVFTPQQLRQLKNNSTKALSISVPVNVSGQADPKFTNRLRANIEETVKRTLREEMR